uniref:Phosphoinositide phospholipase C n=1 Tax=Neobodo designis TaxID=312471 RepID=A0A7S1PZE3_NEODS|mmetsp:Transcript_26556/g.82069  ORF Transcript_26556/g.82069 Transcript_26556/m.82069 type:complete len:1069 (+) Transcript_26556:32-3238(+)
MACCGSSSERKDDAPLHPDQIRVPHVTINPQILIRTIGAMTRGLRLKRRDSAGRLRDRSLVLRRTFDYISYSPSRKNLAHRSIALDKVHCVRIEESGASTATDEPSADNEELVGAHRDRAEFVVHIDTGGLCMTFVFHDADDARAVAESIAFLIRKRRTFHDEAAQRMAMLDLWIGAKLNDNEELPFSGLVKIAHRLGWTWSREELRQWFNEMDGDNGSGGLDFDELCHFFDELTMRQQLAPLFLSYTESESRLLMPPIRVAEFFHVAQGEHLSIEAAEHIVREHGMDTEYWSFSDFCQFLNSPALNSWVHPAHSTVHQDMTQPLHHYFIGTSHNTCVVGSQVDAEIDPLGVGGALRTGARVIDIAITDFEGQPHAWRPYTFTSPVPARAIFAALSENAFATSDFPVIVLLEIYGGTTCADSVADIVRETIGDAVHTIRTGVLKTPSAAAHLEKATSSQSDVSAISASPSAEYPASDGSDSDLYDESEIVGDAEVAAVAALGQAQAAARKARRAFGRVREHTIATRQYEREARKVLHLAVVEAEVAAEMKAALAAEQRKREWRRDRIARGLSVKEPPRVPMVARKTFESPATNAFRRTRVYYQRARLCADDAIEEFRAALRLAEDTLRAAKETNAVHRPRVDAGWALKPTPFEALLPPRPKQVPDDLLVADSGARAIVEDESLQIRDAQNAAKLADAAEECTAFVRGLATRANILRELAEEAAGAARVTPGSLRRRVLLAYKCDAESPDFRRPDTAPYFVSNRERFAFDEARSSALCHLVSFTSYGDKDRSWQPAAQSRLRAVPEALCVAPLSHIAATQDSRGRAVAIADNRDDALTYAVPESENSENASPFHAFAIGVSMVGMNFQTFDDPMRRYDAFFRQNGRCGYVLKPEYLRTKGVLPGNQPFTFVVRILMGTQLPGPEIDRKNHFTRWKVIAAVDSPPDDFTHEGHAECTSSAQTSERAMPYWNEEFRFDVTNVALSLLTVRLVDEEEKFDNDIAEAAVPLPALRLGYRAVPLVSSATGHPLKHASLLVHVAVHRTTAVAEVRSEKKLGLRVKRHSIMAPRRG